MLTAVAFNATAGAACAVAIGCAPEAGAVAGNVLALALGSATSVEFSAPEFSRRYAPANRSSSSAQPRVMGLACEDPEL